MIYGIMLIVIVLLLGCCCIIQTSNKNKNEDLEQLKKETSRLANDYAKSISSRNEWMSRTMAECLKAKKKDEKIEMLCKDVEKYKKLYLDEIERNIKLANRKGIEDENKKRVIEELIKNYPETIVVIPIMDLFDIIWLMENDIWDEQ